VKLSVLIPARNEAESIAETVEAVSAVLERERLDHEIVVIDDSSSDGTAEAVEAIAARKPAVRCHRSHNRPGFGFAVRSGLDVYEGDAVAIFMADLSDDPEDLVRYHRLLDDGFDCAFGSRLCPARACATTRASSW
jgi:dolichol-phosphate mannosyltransferase